MTTDGVGAKTVFVDTGAFAAIANAKDQYHDQALASARTLAERGVHLVTTNFVVAETHALLVARAGREIARSSLHWIDGGAATLIRVDDEDEQRAREIIDTYLDKDFTLVDAMSFSVMERLRISVAFTFDRHFQQFGFAVAEPR